MFALRRAKCWFAFLPMMRSVTLDAPDSSFAAIALDRLDHVRVERASETAVGGDHDDRDALGLALLEQRVRVLTGDPDSSRRPTRALSSTGAPR
jgi:hypothetical protein